MNKQSLVSEFMRTFGQGVAPYPSIPSMDTILLRQRLIIEESNELFLALHKGDIVDAADGLADLLYVVYGTASACGIDINPIFQEVHRSNMSKTGGVINEHGKLIKPPTYSPPKLQSLIDAQLGEASLY